MSASRVQLQPAFVLHARPYSDTSLLLEIWSRDYGRCGLIARGARRAKSRTAGLLQPFNSLSLSWSGRGELPSLVGVESRPRSAGLTGNRLLSGLYINELLYRLCERHDPHPALFDAYEYALVGLAGPNDEAAALRRFEKALLMHVGYGLDLERDCETGAAIDPQSHYIYLADGGARLTYGTARSSRQGVEISGLALLALASDDYSDVALCIQIKRLMRFVLDFHLGGRPLLSRQWRASLGNPVGDMSAER